LLGRELRQLFEDFVQEDVPHELQNLALQLQIAMAESPPGAQAVTPVVDDAPPAPVTEPVAPQSPDAAPAVPTRVGASARR
jgi:hypothetical protein